MRYQTDIAVRADQGTAPIGVRWPRVVGVVALLANVMCLSGPVSADSVGGAAKQLRKGQWGLAADAGTVFDRNLKAGTGASKASIFYGSHVRGYGLTDWLTVYGRIGGGVLRAEIDAIDHNLGGGFMLGGGVRTQFWRSAKRDLTWDGSLQYMDLRSRDSGDGGGSWEELQVATGVTTTIGRQRPYAGMKLSFVEFDFTVLNPGALDKTGVADEDNAFGLYTGTEFYVGKSEVLLMNVETAYQDGLELSVTLSARY